MPIATSNGRRLNYELQGNGDAVLMFASSLGTSLELWDRQTEALAPHFQVLRYDYRGHGRSFPSGEAASVADFAADALAVMDAAGVGRAHFIGLSLGGMIGQHLALHAPGRLLSLTLCATAAYLPPPDAWEQRARNAVVQGMAPFIEISRGRWFTPHLLASAPDVAEGALAQLAHVDPASYAVACRVIRDFDLRSRVSEIRLPVQLIAGEQDPSTPPAALEGLRAEIPGATMTILSPAAHLLNLERPDEVSRLIASFARRHHPDQSAAQPADA